MRLVKELICRKGLKLWIALQCVIADRIKVLNCGCVILDFVKNCGQMGHQLQLGCGHKDSKSLDVAATIMVANRFLKPWTALGSSRQ